VRRDRDKIKEFVNRIWPTSPEHEVEAAGKRVLNRLRAELAEHDTSVRSLYGDGWHAEPVNQREFQVLTAIAISGDKPTASRIRLTIKGWGVNISFGTVFITLDRLEDRGLVAAGWIDIVKRDRRYYRLRRTGARALVRARAEGKPLVNSQEDTAKGPCTERIR
jgi:DNA-binding PadR family transcriptional regulator